MPTKWSTLNTHPHLPAKAAQVRVQAKVLAMELPNPAMEQLLELLEPLEPPAPTKQGIMVQLLEQDFLAPTLQAQDFLAQEHLEMSQQHMVQLEPPQEFLGLLEPMELLEPPPEPTVPLLEPLEPMELLELLELLEPLESLELMEPLDHHPSLLRPQAFEVEPAMDKAELVMDKAEPVYHQATNLQAAHTVNQELEPLELEPPVLDTKAPTPAPQAQAQELAQEQEQDQVTPSRLKSIEH